MRHKTSRNIAQIDQHCLCIGCGFCRVVCPHQAITISWSAELIWRPVVDDDICVACGACLHVCPNSPERLAALACTVAPKGACWGLQQDATCAVAFDPDAEQRFRSASGGVLTAVGKYLLEKRFVSGVIAALPEPAALGRPHARIHLFRSAAELEQGRSSHYHPLNYADVLQTLEKQSGEVALVGVPCIIRSVQNLPALIRAKIKYTFCLVCSHNVSGAFTDCLAQKEGGKAGQNFIVNLRDKYQIPDANNYNTYIRFPDREIRKNRFQSAFTDMWRNYFFARECCFYCPDFWGGDADLSVKDAWGKHSRDPLGKSQLIVRNQELAACLCKMAEEGSLTLEESDTDEVLNSQPLTATFKQVDVVKRMVWKRVLRQELSKMNSQLTDSKNWCCSATLEYFRLRTLMRLSSTLYFNFGRVPVRLLIWGSRPFWGSVSKVKKVLNRLGKSFLFPLVHSVALFLGIIPVRRRIDPERLRVLIAGGYGYGNVGDEAQLAANLQYWKKVVPRSTLTVLTPNRMYTEELHGHVRTALATRLSLFGRGECQYFGSDRIFKRRFFMVAAVCLFNARLVRAGLPTFGLTTRQARLMDELNNTDVLFLSGGGYLTGMTLTRLWDHMLLINLAHSLGVPTLLSGQTIGLFKGRISRILARWGLKKAEMIYLRDHFDSPKSLAEIGIPPNKIKATFDDALFFEAAPRSTIADLLLQSGINPDLPYLVINAHYWGQNDSDSRSIMQGLAKALDFITKELGLQVVFVPMVYTDEPAIREVAGNMQENYFIPQCNYNPALVVGVIQNASFCITMKHHPIIFSMAAGIPTISLTFDDYYRHKNVGAQKIFAQDQYILHNEITALDIKLIELFKNLYDDQGAVRKCIKKYVLNNRPMAAEVIYRWKKSVSAPPTT